MVSIVPKLAATAVSVPMEFLSNSVENVMVVVTINGTAAETVLAKK